MSAKINIATAADLATKEAYINTDLVDAYIQKNVSEGVTTYTLSFIKKDEEDPNLSEVVELDYARPSDVPTKNYNELVAVCTDLGGLGLGVNIISADSTMADDITIAQVGLGDGTFSVTGSNNFLDLTEASLMIGSFQGLAAVQRPIDETSPILFQTKKTVLNDEGGGVYNISEDDTPSLLNETTIVLRVPIAEIIETNETKTTPLT